MRIVYMGTPEFAVAPLNAIVNAGHDVAAVVTVPDKPAGRGLAMSESAVKKYSIKNNLCILQPNRLKENDFINQLQNLHADVFVVVAFRMLPTEVWKIPPKGCINLHASLLPQFRGAAPINHAIINGEEVSGVTTFFINENIDTGNIIFKREVRIESCDNAGTLHDKLMSAGSTLLVDTLKAIEQNTVTPIPQSFVILGEKTLKTAPKIFRENCKIHWNMPAEAIYNFIRGLSPYPGAFSHLTDKHGNSKICKIFESTFSIEQHKHYPGTIITDNNNYIQVAVQNGFINLLNIQTEGKKRMNTPDFLRGNSLYGLKFE